jgi:hypothetical protein
LAGVLTPKAIIWIVMQITKIHFLTSAALGGRERRSSTDHRGGKRSWGATCATQASQKNDRLTDKPDEMKNPGEIFRGANG